MNAQTQGKENSAHLRIRLEFGDAKINLEGPPDQVIRALLAQLSELYPALELARRLTFTPDLAKLSEALTGLAEFSPEGLILNTKEAPADEAILLALLAMYVGYRIGKLENDSLSASSLAKVTGKALKTITNQIAWIVDDGLVERVGRGEYRITSLGIKRAEQIATALKKEGNL
jgi:hypothetical protein